ncbi:hypothetical protein [Streptomyces sp. NPDC058613]|uniref:hypothetical protein n=1 Tax=unclassified Streptomyces TaxID=2593676 RepID=UPI00364C9F40
MVMVRLDVPAQSAASAGRFVADVRAGYGLAGSADDDGREEAVSRIPRDVGEWITVPSNEDSEELYREVFDRISTEPASGDTLTIYRNGNRIGRETLGPEPSPS